MADVYYKVTNLSPEPLTRTWNKALLDEEDRAKLEQFMQSEDFLGRDREERNKKKKVAPEIRLRPFFSSLGKEVQVKVYDPTKDGSVLRYEWRWCIGPDERKLKDLERLKVVGICDKFEVDVKDSASVSKMTKALVEKFGSNVKYLTQMQWEESGLIDLERKNIKLKLQPGQSRQEIVTEGFLKAEPLTRKQYLEMTKDEGSKD